MTTSNAATLRGLSAVDDEPVLIRFVVESSQELGYIATLEASGIGLLVSQRSSPDNELSFGDLLDLSICLQAIAARENTTEALTDVDGGTEYTPEAQWFLSAFLLKRCIVQMAAKNKPRFAGKRLISFYFDQGDASQLIRVVPLWCHPAEVVSFARALRRMYEELWGQLAATDAN